MRKWMIRSAGLAALASTLVFSAAAVADDLFLKLDGIAGESVVRGHEKEIDIESFQWGFSQQSTARAGGGAGAGKPAFQDFSVTKRVDTSSPVLLQTLLQGRSIKTATFVAHKANAERGSTLIKIVLENVRVTDIKLTGSESGEPTESVSLSFTKLSYHYFPVDRAGKQGPAVSATWDVSQNRP